MGLVLVCSTKAPFADVNLLIFWAYHKNDYLLHSIALRANKWNTSNMHHSAKLLILIIVLFQITQSAQYSPLLFPRALSSSYLENRGSRYHAGFDFQTGDSIGVSIAAPEDGWISRLRVSPFGYGKAVYFKTQNLIYVFAHLDGFNEPIDTYITHSQSHHESNEVNIYPSKSDSLYFKKGDILAYSGETGIGDPHLHFETRSTSSRTVDPTPYSTFVDTIDPEISYIAIKSTHINPLVIPLESDTIPVPIVRNINSILINIRDFADAKRENALSIQSLSVKCNNKRIFKKSYHSQRYGRMSTIRHELTWSIEDTTQVDGDWHALGSNTQHTEIFKPNTFCDGKNNTLSITAVDFSGNSTTKSVQWKDQSIEFWYPHNPWGNQDSLLFTYLGEPHILGKRHEVYTFYDTSDNKLSLPTQDLSNTIISLKHLSLKHPTLAKIRVGSSREIKLYTLNKDSTTIISHDTITVRLTPEVKAVLTTEISSDGSAIIIHPKGLAVNKKVKTCFNSAHANKSTILQYLTESKREWSTYSTIQKNASRLCSSPNELRDTRIFVDVKPPSVDSIKTVRCRSYEQCHSKAVLYLHNDVSGFSSGNQLKTYIDSQWTANYFDNERNSLTIRLSKKDMHKSLNINVSDDAGNVLNTAIELSNY